MTAQLCTDVGDVIGILFDWYLSKYDPLALTLTLSLTIMPDKKVIGGSGSELGVGSQEGDWWIWVRVRGGLTRRCRVNLIGMQSE